MEYFVGYITQIMITQFIQFIPFLCAVQLQHLVEVILVGVGGGGAYLQVCVVQVVAARWLRGGAR